MTDHQLCQTKPSETEASNEVEEGLATLEQEQQLWRPGVKAEQVRESLLVLKKIWIFIFHVATIVWKHLLPNNLVFAENINVNT